MIERREHPVWAPISARDDRVAGSRMDPRAAVRAISGDLRQSLQIIISARDVLARRLGGEVETVQLALIDGAVMRLAGTLDLISNVLRLPGECGIDCQESR